MMPPTDELNSMSAEAFVAAMAPLFEGTPRFLEGLADARPFEDEDDLVGAARRVAREMPEEEQVELLASHPRIGADPASVSPLSHAEQGYDEEARAPDDAWVADELAALNDAYESRFGFRFVVFVAGRPRREIIPLLERALHAERDEELRRATDDLILIAADRMRRLRGPRALSEDLREAVALEVSRWMVGETDQEGLVRASHRLIEAGVESQALLDLSLADDVAIPVETLLREIGLEGWDTAQAAQLLALHAAASIIGEVSQPIDGARRIVTVSGNPQFRDLVSRWEAEPARHDALEAEIRNAASALFGETHPAPADEPAGQPDEA